jgi:hypothetical protein
MEDFFVASVKVCMNAQIPPPRFVQNQQTGAPEYLLLFYTGKA